MAVEAVAAPNRTAAPANRLASAGTSRIVPSPMLVSLLDAASRWRPVVHNPVVTGTGIVLLSMCSRRGDLALPMLGAIGHLHRHPLTADYPLITAITMLAFDWLLVHAASACVSRATIWWMAISFSPRTPRSRRARGHVRRVVPPVASSAVRRASFSRAVVAMSRVETDDQAADRHPRSPAPRRSPFATVWRGRRCRTGRLEKPPAPG